MKYTKKLYYADFTSGRLVRPKNQAMRLFTDILISPWYVFLFIVVCFFYPTAIFADSYRFLRLQYLRNNDNFKKGAHISQYLRNFLAN